VFKNGSRRRKEADFSAKNTSASLPRRLRLLRRFLNSPWTKAPVWFAFARQPVPKGWYLFSVAQIFNLPYRRFVIGRTLLAGGSWQVKNLRYSAARPSRNQNDPTTDEHGWTRIRESLSSSVLIRVHPWLKKSSRAATISGDTDRLQVCATGAARTLNRHKAWFVTVLCSPRGIVALGEIAETLLLSNRR
jgi:hypothetical protein